TIKNPISRSVDLKIYVPQKISNINCKIVSGKIKIFDQIKCNLNIEMNMVNTEISVFKGKIVLKGDKGDLRINSGQLLPDSFVKLNNGSIIIKAELASQGKYDFETDIGNVDLTFPKESKINIENIGMLDVNEFISEDATTKVSVVTGMGKITLKKY
ncbi:MAG: hypothetical protein Q7R95_07290, partial [bacterium]|nr:hypothetical protein [bacterium]